MRSNKRNKPAYNIGREIAELKRGMDELGIAYDPHAVSRFKTYLEVLYSYHGRVHLLSHQDYERISLRHFLPSLIILTEMEHHKRICDVGSGAGFPSVPLKILLPELELVIFEAQRKKANFLKHLIESLDLRKIDIINGRAEKYSGAKFDLALLRAVGKVGKLVSVLDLLLESGAKAIFFKTKNVQAEIEAAKKALLKHSFHVSIRETCTPLEKLPLALVTLHKS